MSVKTAEQQKAEADAEMICLRCGEPQSRHELVATAGESPFKKIVLMCPTALFQSPQQRRASWHERKPQ